ncbi:MAG: AEC family transporter [Rhodobacteraceae bacterium CG17_big_fil_post_rev_8_21_14_2_50_65_11]|nr:MAG: AEC family transporter [Rhodobacteraceae bacterium CG17_big_fil_post_rev_8_21_14_2_50_65_11]
MDIVISIAPVFALICLGYGLRRGGIPSAEFWNLNDRLVYFLLMPALFYVRISTADLSGDVVLSLASVLYAAFFLSIGYGIVASRLLHMSGAVATSLLQGVGRFNTFIGLAVAEALYGAPALQIAVLAAVVLVPVVNLTVVGLFAVWLPRPGARPVVAAARGLAFNPLILSILAGLLANWVGLGGLPVLHDALSILGAAALPIMLLCVGANLKLRGLSGEAGPIVVSAVGKLVLFPALVLWLALVLGVDPMQAQVMMIYGALPTGVAAYTLSRQLGGDAPLMATMITAQAVLSFATMPIWIAVGEAVFL